MDVRRRSSIGGHKARHAKRPGTAADTATAAASVQSVQTTIGRNSSGPHPVQPADYEFILSSIREAICCLDAHGRITYVNPSAVQMLGWTVEEVLGQEHHSLLHHERIDDGPHDGPDCPILASLRDGQVRSQDADVFWRKDGTGLPVDYITTPILGDGRVVGAVVAFRDIAEREAVVRQLTIEQSARSERERLTESLSRINRELDQFAYVASHDLRAPLRGIATLATWIEDDLGQKLGDESRKHLTLLRARIHRMEALIDGILQYSRAGRVRNRVEPVNVDELLADVVEMLNVSSEAMVEIRPGMPTFDTERLPLQQVFLNLIGNALKHSRRPDTKVTVNVCDNGDAYEFSVADNGPGIPPQFHTKIWEIFQTLQPRDKVEGAGIGLALVKKHVDTRGGKVWLESVESRGATFRFLWPKQLQQEP